MAPTVEVDRSSPSSSPSSSAATAASSSERLRGRCSGGESESFLARPGRNLVDLAFTLDDYDNSCETYFCSKDVTPSSRSVIPEASPAFREAMGKLKLERSSDASQSSQTAKNAQLTSTSSTSSPATSSKSKSSSSSSSSSSLSSSSSSSSSSSTLSSSISSSSHLSPSYSENGSAKSSHAAFKSGNARRPASFGGADVVKPRTSRRASHSEKRVSWADERGSDHQLISVRLIRPRLSKDVNTRKQSSPGHSILRTTGTC